MASEMTNTQPPAPGVAAILRDLLAEPDRTLQQRPEMRERIVAALQASAAWGEPVGDMLIENGRFNGFGYRKERNLPDGQYKLYTAPPFPAQVQAAEVTDEQADEIANACYRDLLPTGYNGGMGGQTWDRALVRAALASRTPVPGMAGGVVVVPQEPTEEMIQAGWNGCDWGHDAGDADPKTIYEAMLAAAPHPAPAQQAAGAERNNPVSALSIRLLVAAGHISQEKADEAFRLACQALEAEATKMNIELPWVPAPLVPIATVYRGGVQAFGKATCFKDWLPGSEQLPDGEHTVFAVIVATGRAGS